MFRTHLSLPRHFRVPAVAMLALCMVLAGCTATRPAPVVERSAPAAAPATRAPSPPTTTDTAAASRPAPALQPQALATPPGAPPAAGPGSAVQPVSPGQTHIVQRGENLYRIALLYGLDMNALAAWNSMTTTQPLREGQVLRLTPPPAAVAQTQPAPSPGAVPPAQPLPAPTTIAAPPAAAVAPLPPPSAEVPLRREPRAVRVPFSDGALAEMQREGRAAATVEPATPAPPTAGGGATAASTVSGEEVRPGAGTERDGIRWTWPTTGRVVTRFNERAPLKGIEIAGAQGVGTAVVAAAAGKVIFVGNELRGCGQMVVISHGEGLVSVYCHLAKISVREQQRVTLGQRIAEIGDSGNSRLHFEVRRQGRPLDPVSVLQR